MPNNENFNENNKAPSLPDGLSSIADDEVITEIDFGDFLEESSKASPLFEGFHEDIEKTEKSLESELQSLYDDIMSSGPETIVPKPMSVLTASEAEPRKVALSDPDIPDEYENNSLDDLWMNPDDYFDADIPVVSLDGEEEQIEGEISDEAFFSPEAETAPEAEKPMFEDDEKSSIFSMIDMLKSETDSETGFDDILSEIESNQGIAPVVGELSDAAGLVTQQPGQEEYDELAFDDDFDWDELELEDEASTPEITVDIAPVQEEEQKPEPELPAENEISAEDKPVAEEIVAEIEPDAPATEDEFDRELAFLLGDAAAPAAADAAPAGSGFTINIPDDGNNYEKAAAAPEKLYVAAPMSSEPVDEALEIVTEDSGKKSKKKNKKFKEKPEKESQGGAGEVIRKIILSVSIITILVSCGILVNTYFIEPFRFQSSSDKLGAQMNENISQNGDSTEIADEVKNENSGIQFPEGMLAKYAQLYAANDDLKGWISIPGFDINLPIVQGTDNKYYLKKDVYGKYTTYGVPFFDYRMTNFKDLHKNSVVYGHNMRHDDLIFGMLENYRFIDEGFQKAPVIECNTIYGDHAWFVYAVFITNGKESQDNGYLFPYNFIDVSNSKFAAYIEEIDKRKLYTTGVDINETDKILTLSTCCYDFEDARLVVVARKRRAGESITVDTSRAYYTEDPKYPQIWYDTYKKTNNYAGDSRW